MENVDMKKWKYESKNTASALYLHDCDCTHILYTNNKIILEMDWMEIMEYHPQNEFSEAHQSGEGVIELLEPELVKCEYEVLGKIESVSDIRAINFENIEFLEFEESAIWDGFACKMYMIKTEPIGDFDNIELEVRYKSSIVKFNELHEKSWFVDFGDNRK